MLEHEIAPGVFEPWDGVLNGIRYNPRTVAENWSDDELATAKLFRVVVPPVPEGREVIGEKTERVNGVVTKVHQTQARPLAEMKAQLADRLIAHAELIGAQFTAGYPSAEQQSWPAKLAEAQRISAGANDPTLFPIIDAEAALSGQAPRDIAATIADKAAIFGRVAGLVAGFRRKCMADIENAQNYADAAIAFEACKAALAAELAALGD